MKRNAVETNGYQVTILDKLRPVPELDDEILGSAEPFRMLAHCVIQPPIPIEQVGELLGDEYNAEHLAALTSGRELTGPAFAVLEADPGDFTTHLLVRGETKSFSYKKRLANLAVLFTIALNEREFTIRDVVEGQSDLT